MKKINILVLLLILTFHFIPTSAQTLNWNSLDSSKHIVNANFGLDYSVSYGFGYGYKLNTKLPIVLNANFYMPSGEQVFDDFKTKIGGKIRFYKIKDFQFSANIYGVFRRYENPLVCLINFGSDISTVAGYYKPKWFVAGEVGFDKAIVTHFKHSEVFKNTIYSNVKDGWYEPATGGNFYYGLQGGYTFKKVDITINLGKVVSQDFNTSPFLPFYINLGINYRIIK